ncbi:MAG TPA: hypothetical protein VME69_06670 [Methylocella sp.]|nr:hypothetical protein [Methylocella sp.]
MIFLATGQIPVAGRGWWRRRIRGSGGWRLPAVMSAGTMTAANAAATAEGRLTVS